ncbi:Acriflavin resistance protein [gamma proteobacterium HdN1]|nr:Acriflavin resistance protein [gamma proteobacterium HdN1]
MNFATLSIRNPIPFILLFFFLTFGGIWGFKHLNIQNFPDLDLPMITVVLSQPGAAPTQLETEVARPVEDAMATLEGMRHLYTSINDGRVSITAQFDLERPVNEALQDVKDAVDRSRNDLPPDVLEPIVNKVNTGPGGTILTYAVSHPSMDEEALSWFTDDTIAHAALSVPGATGFTRIGGVTREVQITVDPVQMSALGVTASDISRALKRVQQDASGGRGQLGGGEQGVRTIATVKRAQDLENLAIPMADGRYLQLNQVATVRDTIAERTQIALIDGKPSVGFEISRTKGYDEKQIADGMSAVIAQLEQDHPGLKFELVRSVVKVTLHQYRGSMQMLLEGAVLAVIVIWWFLRDWRATVLGAVALPLSIIPAFGVMYLFDFSLNTITLLGLAVVVGILVDDAVVEVENIYRHINEGKPVKEATIEAVNEIALAVIATTAALVAVFLPTALMTGISGMVFKQFGWTVVAAVIASLMVARLVTPMMAVWMLKGGYQEPKDGWAMRSYLKILRWCLAHRKTTVAGCAAFFFGTLSLVPLMSTSFMPPEDYGFVIINMEMPPGTNLETTAATAEMVRHSLDGIPGIESIFTSVGSFRANPNMPNGMGEVRKGTLNIVLTDRDTRPTQQEIEAMIRPRLETIPGARLSIGYGNPGEKLQILLVSQNPEALNSTAGEVERELRALPYFSGITSTASLERAEITIRPNDALSADRGVSTQAIGETVRIALAGDFEQALSKLNLDNRQLDIRVQVPEELRHDLNAIGNLRVPGRSGLVPLSSIAELSVESGPNQIDRYNRQRQVTITVDLGGYPLGGAVEIRDSLPSIKNMPASVKLIESGDAEILIEMMSGFAIALLTGIFLVYATLVLLFRDWFQPVTILSAIPMSIGGAFIAMVTLNYDLGLATFIGLIMLLGVVSKNSILLVDFAVMAERDHGMTPMEAVLDACHKRARPIVMTTVAMIAGLLPLAFGIGGKSAFRTPMAVAVIGGLITSTGLSLLVVPVVYLYIGRLKNWLGRNKSDHPSEDTVEGSSRPATPLEQGAPHGDTHQA